MKCDWYWGKKKKGFYFKCGGEVQSLSHLLKNYALTNVTFWSEV